MPKRAHSLDSDSDHVAFPASGSEDDEIDISSVLAGKKRVKLAVDHDSGDEDKALQEIIRKATAKRDVKGGTDIVKKAKGKSKLTKGEVGGGSFQSMGLHPWLLRSLTLQGYRIPTPIQRQAIPLLLSEPPQDLVGMARTGSGKSLAYMIPLVQRLGGRHSTTFGARALILLPTRELALQLLKVGKELARGYHSGEGSHAGDDNHADSSKGQGLRWGLVVGGEGLDEQFEMITNNPDVIIATPGRLLHLIVEMNLDLKGVQYVVFDEADRLFEMGFETALTEIIGRMPAARQTLLFSATLPKSLVEFAKAGLDNPKLVRLDAEGKISTDLKMAFFAVKQAEKDACLLILLRDIIGVPLGGIKEALEEEEIELNTNSKSKGKRKVREQYTAPHQTLIFAATKHHVEYLTVLLTTAGYSISQIYGTLDQTARSMQMDRFRRGVTNILVVTDVAARGIDIPVLENVVNYDFPQGSRVFVHRVGRTARAGRSGWAWSFLTVPELPYLLDLQLFLARPLKSKVSDQEGDQVYTESLVLGPFSRDKVDEEVEYVNGLEQEEHNLPTLRDVMRKGHGMYERSKGKASQASYKRAKDMMKDAATWGLPGHSTAMHPILRKRLGDNIGGISKDRDTEDQRIALLKLVNTFKPSETVFEVAHKGKGGVASNSSLMKERRKALTKAVERASLVSIRVEEEVPEEDGQEETHTLEMADEVDIASVFDPSGSKKDKKRRTDYRDSEFYMSYVQKDAETEKGYSLRDGATFAEQAKNVAFDLLGDDGTAAQRAKKQMTWDKKKKKFVQGDGAGADNVKMVKTESGAKLPASYRSGRFDEWKAKNRTSLPRVGEVENGGPSRSHGGRKYLHNKVVAAKGLDKLSTTYERKVRQQKKKEQGADAGAGPDDRSSSQKQIPGGNRPALGKRYGGKSVGRVKTELKTVDQIRKARQMSEKKRAKNARPSARGKGKGGGKRR